MAGSYPNVPSRRMATDDDGTIGMRRRVDGTTVQTEFNETLMDIMNDESETAWQNFQNNQAQRWQTLIFPELRELDGMFYSYTGVGNGWQYESSGDTTNGFDGTWTQRIADVPDFTVTAINYRTGITSLAVSNVRSTRLRTGGTGSQLSDQFHVSLHTYGEISAGETPDRLLWVDEITGLEFVLPIDYGDAPRGSARDRGLRLKNNSGTLTANTLQITAEDLHGGSGAWYTYDVAGGGFVATNSDIASLGAGANSALITIRQIIPDAAGLGLQAARSYVNVSSWS